MDFECIRDDLFKNHDSSGAVGFSRFRNENVQIRTSVMRGFSARIYVIASEMVRTMSRKNLEGIALEMFMNAGMSVKQLKTSRG